MVFRSGRANDHTVLEPAAANRTSTAPDDWELESLLDVAVKPHMVSDVPIGAFLSGGIDCRYSSL